MRNVLYLATVLLILIGGLYSSLAAIVKVATDDCSAILLGQGQEGVAYLIEVDGQKRVLKRYLEPEYFENDFKALWALSQLDIKNFKVVRFARATKSEMLVEYLEGPTAEEAIANDRAARARYDALVRELQEKLFITQFRWLHFEVYSIENSGPPRLAARYKEGTGALIRILIKPDNLIYQNGIFVLFDPH